MKQNNPTDAFDLPRDLGDGLVLRWATPDDAAELADFNIRLHSDDPEEPEAFLGYWTKDLMSGDHPTTSAGDFTVVVDTHNGDKIVSSLNLISQTWTYDDIPFGVGRPELVATDPDYRRRGLVRAQMDVVHAKSAARGEIVQAITGIPWYYRQFGYEMMLNLGGSRQFYWVRPGNDKPVEEETYSWREATVDDVALLTDLYAAHCQKSLISRLRDETLWRYEIAGTHPKSNYNHNFRLIANETGEVVGYLDFYQWGTSYTVQEFGVLPGHSWRPVALFAARQFKKMADEANQERKKPIVGVSFNLGEEHPVYEALGWQLEKQVPPYAWFIRVPDIAAFLGHIQPVLERRLAESVLAGHSGKLRLNFYQSQLEIVLENGRFTTITPYEPEHFFDCDVFFPDLTFLQLLFCYRSFDELNASRADLHPEKAEAAILLNCLFPKRPSWIRELG